MLNFALKSPPPPPPPRGPLKPGRRKSFLGWKSSGVSAVFFNLTLVNVHFLPSPSFQYFCLGGWGCWWGRDQRPSELPPFPEAEAGYVLGLSEWTQTCSFRVLKAGNDRRMKRRSQNEERRFPEVPVFLSRTPAPPNHQPTRPPRDNPPARREAPCLHGGWAH